MVYGAGDDVVSMGWAINQGDNMNENYEYFISRKKREYGDNFDPSDLAPQFVPYFRTGKRIKVETCGMTITGTVGVTTGRKPCFLLLRKSNSTGSSWTLGKDDKIVAVQYGKHYV